jgi:hypothetical protein
MMRAKNGQPVPQIMATLGHTTAKLAPPRQPEDANGPAAAIMDKAGRRAA